MANVNYKDLFWQVRAELPGVPTPLLYGHYADAVREFFLRSLAWQYNIADPLDLAANTAWPTVAAGTEIPADTYVVQPVKVKFKGNIVHFKTRDQLDEIDEDWEDAVGTSPSYWTITAPLAWRVYPLLSSAEAEAMRLRVALAPVSTATSIPEELANEFQMLWAQGALARLLKIPGKDWTNPNLASSYMQMYDSGIKMAKSRAAADFGRPHRQVEYGGIPMGGSGRRNTDDYGR